MTDGEAPRGETAICGFDADRIEVRGRDLVTELMGKIGFTELIVLQALGVEPTPMQTRIVDAVLVTIMEHGLVPSAVATRLTHYGAPESFQGAVAAGLLGVGDRYAGTAGECGAILERIVAADKDQRKATAEREVRAYREKRRAVPGFGHPIHRSHDPRVDRLLDITKDAGAKGEYVAAMRLLESSLHEVLGKPLVMNVSAAIAAALAEAGLPATLMRGIVLIARCAGLVGHLHEEIHKPVAHGMWQAAQSRVTYKN